MAAFFNQPPRPYDAFEFANTGRNVQQEMRQEIMDEAEELQEAMLHLRDKLMDEGVAPNIEIVQTEHEKTSIPSRLGNAALSRLSPQFHLVSENLLAEGWIISVDNKKNPSRVIVLVKPEEEGEELELKIGILGADGKMHIDQPVRPTKEEQGSTRLPRLKKDPADNKYKFNRKRSERYRPTGVREIPPDSYGIDPYQAKRVGSLLDLETYPIHPLFTSENSGYTGGYTPAHGRISRLLEFTTGDVLPDHRGPLVSRDSPEAQVALNLEHLTEDARAFGRYYLGMGPAPQLYSQAGPNRQRQIPANFHEFRR
jgi:hypothetical protein